MQLDFSQDWRQWDNTTKATLVSVRNPVLRPTDPSVPPSAVLPHSPNTEGDMSVVISVARKRSLTTKEATNSGGAYVAGDVSWLLPQALIPAGIDQPKAGDKILEDDDSEWTVLQAIGQRLDVSGDYTVWKCITRNLAIFYDLQDLITIQEPVEQLDTEGAAYTAQWKNKYVNLPAAVQLISLDEAEKLGIRGFTMVYEIPIARDIAITQRDRIVWGDSPTGYLEVVGYQNPQRIDELPSIRAGVPVA